MSPEERSLLNRFLEDLGRARGGLKDAEAAGVIDRAVRSNPDAAYLLVQHAILSDQALHAAQAQIAELQAQLQGAGGPPQGQGGFLGGGPWSRPQAQSPQYAPPSQGQSQAQPQPQGLFGSGPAAPGGFGSFLRSAGTTAAGVAGGAFLFDSLSGLFGGHHGLGGLGGGLGGGFGGGFGGGWGGAPMENVTINEYGGQPDDGGSYDDGSDIGDDGGYDDGGVS